ncbi:dihydrofolate reductase [Actinomycetota bacterium]|nr:dihydrofolate reductase [Actinomycetota bacterium]MDC0654972.1 dihydrofolate reductase [bacterium]
MLTVIAPSDLQLSDSHIDVDLGSVGFYVPPYMGPPSSLEVIAQMPNVEVVQLLTVGFDSVLKYLPDHVRLCNAVGVHDASAAELAVALTLASLRGIDDFARAMPEGKWLHERRDSLVDRSVVIVGAGGVGQGIANRMVPFEVDVTLVARSQRPGVLSTTELPRLLPLADIVILAVPLTTHTADLVDDAFLSQMRDGALLVNMARGGVVNTDALVRHAQQGRIRAALDVTDPEPLPPEHPLWRIPGVLISPHVGGDTSAFLPRAKLLVESQIGRWRSGDPLAHVVQRKN